MNKNTNSLTTQFKMHAFILRLLSSLLLGVCIATGVVNAASQCEKEYPIADTFGQIQGGGFSKSPTELLRARCPVEMAGSTLTESTVQVWTAPTREQPYTQWAGVCWKPVSSPKPESPVCKPDWAGGWCGGYDGTSSTVTTIRIDVPFCNGQESGRMTCGNGDGYLRCPGVNTDKSISSCGDGNPIDCTIANKHQAESDIAGGDTLLSFARTYNSVRPMGYAGTRPSEIGANWRHTYSRAVYGLNPQLTTQPESVPYVSVLRPNGQSFQFVRDMTSSLWEATADITDRLVDRRDASNVFIGFDFYDSASDNVETYDANGRLSKITARSGRFVNVEYDSDGIKKVTDSFGRSLTFQMTGGVLTQMTDSNGGVFQYQYDTALNLVAVVYPDNSQRQYHYNEPAHTSGANLPNALTGITDEAGQRFATFEYNTQGQATVTKHAGETNKYTLSYPYNSSVVTGPLGDVSTRGFGTYAGRVKILSRTQSAGAGYAASTSNFSYDDNANMTLKVDFSGKRTTYAYDLARNLETSRTEAEGIPRARTITTQWHPTYRMPIQIDEPGKRTTYTYDTSGNVLTTTVLDTTTSTSRTTTYTYNAFGRVLTIDGPRIDVSDITTYTYYECSTGYQCGQVQTVTDALNHVTTFNTYNANGQPLTITDANGVQTMLTYDERQRLKSRTIGGEVTGFDYWPTGQLKQVTLPDGSFLSYTYDSAHRLTGISDSLGNSMVYTLDLAGNRTAENLYDPSSAMTRSHARVFDSLSRMSQDLTASGSATQATLFGYDANGNPTTTNAPMSRNATNGYDELNRLKQVTDANNGLTQYGYNALDQLISVTDPRNLQTTYTYNALGDLTQQVSPDTGATINTFDEAGNLKTTKDARNKTATYTYDALNRVTQVVYSDQTITYAYDSGPNAMGRLSSVTDTSGSTFWSYSPQGRIASKTQVIGANVFTVQYGYNAAGQLTTITTPSNKTITYGYTNNQVTSMMVNSVNLLSNVLYEPFGPTSGWTWGNGTLAVRTYDTDGKLTQLDSAGFKTIGYDDAFRITSVTDQDNSANSWSYGYDTLDRLTSAIGSQTQSFTFDANGNRLTQGGTTSSTLTVSPTNNRLSSVSGAVSKSYLYDNAGNATSDGTATYTYNDSGRMTSVTKSGVTTTYTYNALGQRVTKTTAGVTTYFVYDEAGHILGEYDSSGSLIEEIAWMYDTPVASIRFGSCGLAVFYIHTDHLNTPRRITKRSTNEIVWRWDSDAFGTTMANENPSGAGMFAFNLRFPGMYQDQETGLLYNGFRYFDPATGRYPTSDPIGLVGGINTYAYVRSNPINRIDPNGLLDVFVGGAMDSTSGIVKDYQQAYGQAHSDRASLYFEWTQEREIMDAITKWKEKNPCELINMVGHSYGGSTASAVSRNLKEAGIDVSLLITVDPVSRIWSRGRGTAYNWIDINAAPGSSNWFNGDAWAGLGGKWGNWPNGKADSYYEGPYHHNDFGNLFEMAPAGGKSALQQLLDSPSACTCQ